MYSNNERMRLIFEDFLTDFGVNVVEIMNGNSTLSKTLLLGVAQHEGVFGEERPKIGVFGKIRSGKSTLGNAIFGGNQFDVGQALELTKHVSKVTLEPVGIEIYDTPGFEGFTPENTERSRQFMRECDLLLYVVKYPGAFDFSARRFYEQEIEPLVKPTEARPVGKPVVTVVNFHDDVPEAKAAEIFAEGMRKLHLPNMVRVCATTKFGVDELLLKVLNQLPERYHKLFQDTVDKRYHERMSKHRALRITASAAALATCTKVNRAILDKTLKDSWNVLVVLVGGLPLEIARIYFSGFDAREQADRIANELRGQRENTIHTQGPSGPFDFMGAIIGGFLGAAATQSTAIALLFGVGVGTGPEGVMVTLAGGSLTAALGWLLGKTLKKHTAEKVEVEANLGGFDAAVGLLSVGAATIATIHAQSPEHRMIAPQQSLAYFQRAYTLYYEHQIRALLEQHRHELENATEGDRAKVLDLLCEDALLRQHFMQLDTHLPTV